MPDNLIAILTAITLQWGLPLAVVFWYACRVHHPRRSRLRAFLMALAVLAVVPPAAFAAFYCWIVVRDGSALAAWRTSTAAVVGQGVELGSRSTAA